ncbi:MAG: PP0621 family protein [Burkholderiales bacterium]
MTKILLWVVIIVVLLLALRLWNTAKARRRSDAGASPPPPAETMIRCSRCGVYLPQKDATPGPTGLTCGEPACLRPR